MPRAARPACDRSLTVQLKYSFAIPSRRPPLITEGTTGHRPSN
jgi:hypothetical protein